LSTLKFNKKLLEVLMIKFRVRNLLCSIRIYSLNMGRTMLKII